MQNRKFGNIRSDIFALGFGCMRLPTKNNVPMSSDIDEQEAIRIIRHGIDQGVTYIDTAYPYQSGMSEIVAGRALRDGYRDKVLLASKSPTFIINKEEDFNEFLTQQLHKLDVDCIDCYLLHALDKKKWEDVVLKFDLLTKMEQAKRDGKIKYIGFSFHDDFDAFKTIVDGYDKWDFCQIQMNYIDIENQACIKGLEYAASKGLGVIIMEPLLGGKLATPPAEVAKVLSPEKTPVEWALDFLWNRPEVSLILSGMSNMQQVEDNLTYADRSAVSMLTAEQCKMFEQAKHVYDTMALVPCTKCSYCMPCPFGLNIPKIYEAYNKTASSNMEEASDLYFSMDTLADACRKCKKCEKICPQAIKSSELMPTIHELFKK
ncbi:MAG TPA: aldo/keto reductase [Oscillospiraceae bacterium]|nr:aldo/keto reductase [Oscillospiraceae bacterium]